MRGAKAQGSGLRIRQFPAPVDAQNYVETRWDMLKTAIVEIQNKNNSGLSFEELYRNAYTMVLHKYGEVLYNGLVDTVTIHLRTHIRPTVEKSITDNFIGELIKCWNDHTVAMVMIRDILMYMDRVYVQQHSALDPVYNLGLRMFRDEILNNTLVNDHLKATMLGMIALERQKESIDWMSLKHACKMLIALGIDSRGYYESQFETHFLRESAEYYRNAGQKFLAENSASVFVRKVNECLTEEKERAERYLDPTTGLKILRVLQQELIIAHMHTIVDLENSGLVFMLNNDRVDDMKLLYQLLHEVDGGSEVVIEALSKFLRSKGERLVNSAENAGPVNPVTYVQNLIDLKAQFDHFLHRAFNDDKEFKKRIQADFEYFLNLNTKSPEFLSLYIDDRLKKGLKSMNEGDADGVLDKAMVLFRFLQDKDIFEKYYKQHLAKRLLFAKSNSDDAEKSMITKLKTECGAHFTSKLEGMFKDMEVSANLMNCFKESDKSDIDLTVRVLTKGHWPTTDVPLCPLPPSAEAAFQAFKSFYLTKHNGRKLSLSPNLGLADLKAVFYKQDANAPGGVREESKILTVTTYQMCVLMRFNHADKLSYSQLQRDTGIPERDLKRALISLGMAKASQRILSRVGAGREIDADDVFSVNDAFTSKLTRIRIQMVSNKNATENEPERREVRQKVEDDRKHEIEAAIVRVMKARKKLSHNELIAEVTRQLQARFRPEPMAIKRRIESLMERQYLKRDDDDTRVYHYVA